jgi:hypothetical protein
MRTIVDPFAVQDRPRFRDTDEQRIMSPPLWLIEKALLTCRFWRLSRSPPNFDCHTRDSKEPECVDVLHPGGSRLGHVELCHCRELLEPQNLRPLLNIAP